MISQYNNTAPQPGPRNLGMLVSKRLTLRGFLVGDHAEIRPQFLQEISAALADGRVQVRETVVEGLENAPSAFIGLLRGENTGKMIVRLS